MLLCSLTALLTFSDGKWIWQTEDRTEVQAEADWGTMNRHQASARCVSLDAVTKKWIVTPCESIKSVICEANAKNGGLQPPETKPIILGEHIIESLFIRVGSILAFE